MSVGDIFSKPYFKDLIQAIRNGSDINAFIANLEQVERDDFLAKDKSLLWQHEQITRKNASIEKIDADIAANDNQQNVLQMLIDVVQICPEDRKRWLSYCLNDYYMDGRINQLNQDKLLASPKGLINRLKNGKQIKELNNRFAKLIEYCDTNGDAGMFSHHTEYEDLDLQYLQSELQSMNTASANKIKERQACLDAIQEGHQTIQNIIANYDDPNKDAATKRTFRRQTIADYIQYMGKDKNLNVSDYVEMLDKMPDDEMVVFDIALRAKPDVKTIADNIMFTNGLNCGADKDKWYLTEYKADNSCNGMWDIFTPLMTVRDAKQIMPKIMRDFEATDLNNAVVLPIRAADLPSPDNYKAPAIDNQELTDFIKDAFYPANGATGGRTVYKDINELAAEYPRDKYLFSGCTASDDFFLFSGRPGRNGLIYATPNIDYAAQYDGVTDIGRAIEGLTATGDKYVSSAIGRVGNHDVRVGFINIYRQSDNDKFYTNFGMEDHRHPSTDYGHTLNILESKDGLAVHTGKTGKMHHGQISRDLAINGYIGTRSPVITVDGVPGYRLDYNAETYVTREKNPLVAKIMHVSWNEKNCFIPVTNEFDKKIVDFRRADTSKTFNPNVFARLCEQRKEYEHLKSPSHKKDMFVSGIDMIKKNTPQHQLESQKFDAYFRE